jgi:hypothetical protein
VPRVIVTDKLKSYGTAKRDLLPGGEHRQYRYLNNRAENSPSSPANGSDACNGSSPQVMSNGSSPPMVPSCCTSAHIVTASPHLPIVKKWKTDSTSGKTSRLRDWLLEGRER